VVATSISWGDATAASRSSVEAAAAWVEAAAVWVEATSWVEPAAA
jgi:hypothetical protein